MNILKGVAFDTKIPIIIDPLMANKQTIIKCIVMTESNTNT